MYIYIYIVYVPLVNGTTRPSVGCYSHELQGPAAASKNIPRPLQGDVQQQYIHEQHLQHCQRSGPKLWLCSHRRLKEIRSSEKCSRLWISQKKAFWRVSELMLSRRNAPKHSQTWSIARRPGQISTQSLRNAHSAERTWVNIKSYPPFTSSSPMSLGTSWKNIVSGWLQNAAAQTGRGGPKERSWKLPFGNSCDQSI